MTLKIYKIPGTEISVTQQRFGAKKLNVDSNGPFLRAGEENICTQEGVNCVVINLSLW